MFNECKQAYESSASSIPGWKNIDKNELCNLYIQNEDNPSLRDAYFSAIILNYWGDINKLYYKTNYTATKEQCYDWLIDSILYALKMRRWLNKDSSVYGDPNGPDKVINRKLKHTRINHLIAANRQKRMLNIGTLSVDEIDDEYEKLYDENEDSDAFFSDH